APAPAEPAPAPVPSGPRALTAIDVQKAADGLVVTLQGSGPLTYEYFLVEGKSLVVDIADAVNKVWPLKKKVGDAWVSQIRLGEHTQPKKATRVVFDLKKVGEYRVAGAGDRIVVSFGAAALSAAPAAPAAAAAALNTVTDVSCRAVDGGMRLTISTSAKPEFTVVDSGDPAKVVVEIANAQIPEKQRKTLDLASLGGDVVKVSAFPFAKGEASLVRVVAQLRQPVPFRTTAESDRVLVDFERAAAPAAAAAASTSGPAAGAAAPAATAAESAAPQQPAARVYTGRRLSLDFKDADVNDILRLISEVSGLNFVAGPEVKGTVTIKLTDVPWDLALDIILKSNQPQLAQVRESENIIRITTLDKILDEEQKQRQMEDARQKNIQAQKAAEPKFTRYFPISYAGKDDAGKSRLEAVAKSLEQFKSSDGSVTYDERTSTIIVTDTAANLDHMAEVIKALDAPTPAVLVEARIVEMTSGYEQQLGVQWNANFIADAQHGNATKYAFPNSISLNGTQASGGNNYLVNLPATSPTAGIGFSFGHIANTLTLDLRLSAMEKLGRTKILSNPKVLVVQNQKALINVGSQLPIPKTDADGNRTVEWKDVGIRLEVTPQVTNDKKIFMAIQIEKSSQGENVQTTEGAMFSINTSRADTKVLIADGETTVIGGIFVQTAIKDDSSVPGLGKLPLIGWLFKSKGDKESKQELMIFLTPRLVTI
ncbi:MAG TPA: type IV pilus secretin PilQ, partial [bacterium]